MVGGLPCESLFEFLQEVLLPGPFRRVQKEFYSFSS
jgi:hypothetical protein